MSHFSRVFPRLRWRDAAVALFLATLLHLRQIAAWTDPKNRYLWQWDGLDGPAQLVSIAALAVVFAAAAALVRRAARPLPTLIAAHALVLVAGFGLASFVPAAQQLAFRAELASLLIVAVVAASAGARSLALPRLVYRACLVLSPLPFVLAVQLLGWDAWGRPDEALPAAGRFRGKGAPVVFVVFDEWSYPRSFAGKDPIEALPRLRELAGKSFVFHAARSAGDETSVTLPKIAQVLGTYEAAGYSTRLLGFYLPYRGIVDAGVDFVRSYPHDPKGVTLPARMAGLGLFNIAHQLVDPLSRRFGPSLFRRVFSGYWASLLQRFESDLAALLESATPGTFTLVHAPIPHCPFIFDAEGRYKGPFVGDRWLGTPEEYEAHLRYMDRIIGGILSRTSLDQTLLVLTSDHSWRHDPETRFRATTEQRRHVPLVVKWPGQSRRIDIERTIANDGLAPYLLLPSAEAAEAALSAP